MRIAMLIIHFLGLAMGLGTSFGFIFLGMAGSKMEKEEGRKFTLQAFAMGRMGHIGLALLIISGLYLITPYWKTLASMPLLVAKLALVLTLTLTVVFISIYSKRAKMGDTETNLRKVQTLGRLSLLTSMTIVVLAVLIFR